MRIRRSLQSKPYPSVPRINWSHPLARGLVLYCYDTGRNNVIDLVSGRGMTSQGAVSPANASAYGYGNKYPDNVSNTGVKMTSSASVEAVALPFSFASGFLQTGTNTQAFPTIFARAANNGATDPFHNYEIQATDAANLVRIAWNNSGVEQTTSAYALTYNKYHTAIGVLSSGAYAFWLDGVQKESGATTWVNSNTNDEVRFANNTGAGGAFPGFVYWGGLWNRALSAAEILRLYTDPYSFLIYPEEMFSRVATSAAAAVVFAPSSFFDQVSKLPQRDRFEFTQGPFKGTSPPLSTTFATSPFFEPVKPKQPIISLPDIMPANSPPRPVGDVWFESIKLKRPIVDDKPPLFQPATVATPNIVEQPFFEQIRLKQPSEFGQGPFAGTSPPLTIPYVTQAFFDQVRLRQPAIDAPGPLFPASQVVVVNLSAANWFDAIKLLKVPDRLGESYSQQSWTLQSYSAWFDQVKLLKIPERLQEQFGAPLPPPIPGAAAFFEAIKLRQQPGGFDYTKATDQQVTIQNALTDWFATVKLKQPIIDQPLVVYFPAQVAPPAAGKRRPTLFIANVGRLMN